MTHHREFSDSTGRADLSTSSTGATAAAHTRPDAAPALLSTAQRREMRDLSIHFNGRRYDCNGYRYDVLADAVAYARLQRGRGSSAQGEYAYRSEEPLRFPADAERELMARLSITFDTTGYRYAGFRYERLSDAVRYAELMERRKLGALAGPQAAG